MWALPEGGDFPEPESEQSLWGGRTFGTPFARLPLSNPKPPDALEDFREVIEGDGSPLSYLSTSILARELLEYGAMWHGRFWREVELAIDDPEVVIDDEGITVRISCSTELGSSAFFKYIDRYQPGSYVFETGTVDVEVRGPGFVH